MPAEIRIWGAALPLSKIIMSNWPSIWFTGWTCGSILHFHRWKPAEPVDGNQDQADAGEIYRILEEEVIPLYYDVSEAGIPYGWVKIMKESIKSNAARFSARRMVKEYVEKFYKKALKNI